MTSSPTLGHGPRGQESWNESRPSRVPMVQKTEPHYDTTCLCHFWLCWGLTSLSTIFQSCRDGAIASWVINQYFRGVKCLAQGHNTAEVGLEPRTSRSGVRHSTTEPPRSPLPYVNSKDANPGSLISAFIICCLVWKENKIWNGGPRGWVLKVANL